MTTYESTTTYINDYLIPALGEDHTNYNLDAIAADILTWHTEHDAQGREIITQGHAGLVERDDVDFWDIVAQHATN